MNDFQFLYVPFSYRRMLMRTNIDNWIHHDDRLQHWDVLNLFTVLPFQSQILNWGITDRAAFIFQYTLR
jgi:hypothetical protein